MTLSKFSLSPHLLFIPAALAAAACELPTKLGDLPTGSATADVGETAGETGDETTGAPAVCEAAGPADELQWTRARDELPGFIRALALAPGGDVVAVGSQADDAFVQVFDPTGAPLWSQTYDGAAGLADRAIGVAVDDAGNIHVLVVERVSQIEGEMFGYADERLVVLRYDQGGALAWRWEHERPPAEPNTDYLPSGAIGLAGDRIVVVEAANDEPTSRVELDAAGDAQAEVAVAVPTIADVERLAIDGDGSAYLAGDFEDNGTHGAWIGRFSPDGSLAWIDQFGSLDDDVALVLPDGTGGVYFAWRTYPPAVTPEHRLRRYDAGGAATWTELLPMTGVDDGVEGGVVRCDGTLLLTGGIARPPAPDLEWDNRRDLWVGRYGQDGAELGTFEHAFGPPWSYGAGGAIAAWPEGGAIVAGAFNDDPTPASPWLGRLGG